MADHADLGRVETWIFDLDNTLYPVTERLLADIDRHIGAFVSEFLGVDPLEARRIQKQYFRDYGLTLRGLMVRHGLDPARYFDHMNHTDLYDIAPAPELARAIAALPGRRLVYTNSSAHHTGMVLERLGMTGLFDGVFDITAAAYVPKPMPEALDALCRTFGVVPGRAAMIDDIVRNLAPAAALGMTTVWIETDADWARVEGPREHVHHVTRDLLGFVQGVLDARAAT
jgi:putative hydrolase of the HAD superfamily